MSEEVFRYRKMNLYASIVLIGLVLTAPIGLGLLLYYLLHDARIIVTLRESGLDYCGRGVIPWEEIEKVEIESLEGRGRETERLILTHLDASKSKVVQTRISNMIDGYDYIKATVLKHVERT